MRSEARVSAGSMAHDSVTGKCRAYAARGSVHSSPTTPTNSVISGCAPWTEYLVLLLPLGFEVGQHVQHPWHQDGAAVFFGTTLSGRNRAPSWLDDDAHLVVRVRQRHRPLRLAGPYQCIWRHEASAFDGGPTVP